MKFKFIILGFVIAAIAGSAFSPTTMGTPEKMTDVKITYHKITDAGVIEVIEKHTINATESKQFVSDWYKQHGIKVAMACQCTTRFDEDACICIERCCVWGGISVGEVCVEQTVSCVGSPQSLCD